MNPVKSYRDLNVWQMAMTLAEKIYATTRAFPKEETYGLTNQIRRAVVSVPSNIAEGSARRNTAEFLNFLSIANGSLAEVETQLLLATRLGFLLENQLRELEALTAETGRMLAGLRRALSERKDQPGNRR
ncbi:MAG: four helix bundle protein [Puniceicoccales bacterium]|nr:four helix bundle protein [Puniceicoccales bacterium]